MHGALCPSLSPGDLLFGEELGQDFSPFFPLLGCLRFFLFVRIFDPFFYIILHLIFVF